MSGTGDDAHVAALVDIARLGGWLAFHPRPCRTAHGWRTAFSGDAGFPDLVLVRPPDVLFVEVKGRTTTLTAAQRRWRDRLVECDGVEWHLWRPGDTEVAQIRLLAHRGIPRWPASAPQAVPRATPLGG